ncbi:hypothetical protein B0O99DRAFT_694281 [Bisporella sp. PMI_857]|nr:hypothetical protein B0O99DRAFT_694281 [Bisporella sp. PMI_857]
MLRTSSRNTPLYAERQGDGDIIPQITKRKRTSSSYALDDSYGKVKAEPSMKRSKNQNLKGVIVGVWSESNQVIPEDKHVVHGFIDVHDRLRTRIYAENRKGEPIMSNMPSGVGGCWVTFERILFDAHLITLNSAEVKEYVKIRSQDAPNETDEERDEANLRAVKKAKEIVAAYETEPRIKPIVNRPAMQPTSSSERDSLPPQSLSSNSGFRAINTPPKASPSDDATQIGVLIGYWADSDSPRDKDKHAVYGVVSGIGSFRVKVVKSTRDGRYLEGNIPTGLGNMWLHFDKVVLEPQLAKLNRAEVKEYVSILQFGSEKKGRKISEAEAIKEAQRNVAASLKTASTSINSPAGRRSNGVVSGLGDSLRHSTRSEQRASAKKPPQQEELTATMEKSRRERTEARARKAEKSRREAATAVEEAAQAELKNNLKKLNKVWIAQQQRTGTVSNASTTPPTHGIAPSKEIKYHNGINYVRKQAGPFQGKLVSDAQILCIDGDDYVEYRVLTKPSF